MKNCITCRKDMTVRDFTILKGTCKWCHEADSSEDETTLERRVEELEKTVSHLSNRLRVQEREMSEMKSMINSFISSIGFTEGSTSANIVELD